MRAALFLLLGPPGREKAYHLRRVDGDLGVAWRLTLPSGRTYDVSVIDGQLSCECLGWLRWGKCKHAHFVEALGLLRKDG